MKILKTIVCLVVVTMASCSSNAQSLGGILGGLGGNNNGSSGGNILSGIIEGVFTKSDLTLADLVGEYKAEGPAVTFKSENFLQKAGGIAAAAAVESKVSPYYEKYGLNGMTVKIDEDANFEMKIKGMTLKGTITKNDAEGTFDFSFKVVGINLGKFTAYVEKSGKNLNLMFDATKLKTFISAVAKFTGNSMAGALGTVLDSYEGLCIGWKLVCTSAPSTTQDSSNGDAISNGLNALKGILNKK